MSVFLDLLNAMVITAMSPNRVAEARFNRNDGLTVEWGPRGLDGLSARQLSGELTRAVVTALSEAGRGVEQARKTAHDRRTGGPDRDPAVDGSTPSDPAVADEPARFGGPAVDRRRAVHHRLRAVEVSGSDAHGFVTVDWRRGDDVHVRVAPSAVIRLDPVRLRDAVNEALAAARARYGHATAAAYAEVHRFDRADGLGA